MKKLSVLLLVLCLLLAGCGKAPSASDPTAPAPAAPTDVTNTPEDPAQMPSEEPVPEPTEETTPAPVLFRHPLTGIPLDAVWTRRPVTIAINNYPDAVPQSGISQADIIHEIEAEGNITRFLALFTDLQDVGTIGSIRSARTYLNNLSLAYDAVFMHCGCSEFAQAAHYDITGDPIQNWQHIDLMFHPSYSFRDQARLDSGYAWEHTLCTTGEMFNKALADMGFDITKEDGYDYGFTFSDDPGISGETATAVDVAFPGGKTTTFRYNTDSGLYDGFQFGNTWIDASDEGDIPMAFRNVLVLFTTQTRPEGVHAFYTLNGSGEGYFACDGQIVKILWERADLYGPFSYTLEDGTPITFGVGKTYIGITTSNNNVSFQ